ncbi:MAG: 4Fe-4S ferredoxin, partial [Polyangiaceae bacterium]
MIFAPERTEEAPRLLTPAALDRLLALLHEDGREVQGPVARDGAVVLAPLRSAADLPAGLTDEQSPGRYRLVPSGSPALFAFNAGPSPFKRAFLLPEVTLVRLRRSRDSVEVLAGPPPPRKLALLGARACDIQALAVQDRVLAEGPYPDADYTARRADVLVIAVACEKAGGTCFCASMGTGPEVTTGFDLSLTELVGPPHRFLVDIGSPAGRSLADRLDLPPAADE